MINNEELIKIEELENKYLKKYYHFLKSVQDEILFGLKTKEDIKNDWFEKWNQGGKKISDFNTGAERVIYALIHSKGFGVPNSCPVGSDLMFEMEDGFLHVDLKTVQTSNIGDFANSIFIGNNQISYNTTYTVNKQERVFDGANLPTVYTKANGEKKYCLTYFLGILHDSETFDTICMYIACLPNGLLQPVYKGDVFKAGKNPDKNRFSLSKCKDFKLIDEKRVHLIYLKKDINDEYRKKLKFFVELEKNK